LDNVRTQVNVEGTTAVNLREKINKIAHTSHVPAPEFIHSIFPKNCPVEISDDLESFISSTTTELFRLNIQDELRKRAMMKNSKFAMSLPSAPSLSSIDAVMGISLRDCKPTLSETESVSSVEFAGRVVLPDIFDDVSNTCSTSVWSLNTESTCLSKQNCTPARCLKEFRGADEVRAEFDVLLNSSSTTVCLKDLPSNLYEENLLHAENKISTSTNTPITEDGISTIEKIKSKEESFNGLKVNLRIDQF